MLHLLVLKGLNMWIFCHAYVSRFSNWQSLKKIAKFINANILPGATLEVGLLCCACVHSYPEEASVYLVKPILMTIMSSFEGTPTTGYVGREVPNNMATKVRSKPITFIAWALTFITHQLRCMHMQATLSPALETALDYYLRVLAISISYAGPVLLNYREELKHVIMSAFQAPSWKVYISSYLSYISTDSNPLYVTLWNDEFPFLLE